MPERCPKPIEEPPPWDDWEESVAECPNCGCGVWTSMYFCCEDCWESIVVNKCTVCGWEDEFNN